MCRAALESKPLPHNTVYPRKHNIRYLTHNSQYPVAHTLTQYCRPRWSAGWDVSHPPTKTRTQCSPHNSAGIRVPLEYSVSSYALRRPQHCSAHSSCSIISSSTHHTSRVRAEGWACAQTQLHCTQSPHSQHTIARSRHTRITACDDDVPVGQRLRQPRHHHRHDHDAH